MTKGTMECYILRNKDKHDSRLLIRNNAKQKKSNIFKVKITKTDNLEFYAKYTIKKNTTKNKGEIKISQGI